MARLMLLVGAVLLAGWGAGWGCAPKVTVERARASETLLRDRQSVLTGAGLSETSRLCLRMLDLEKAYTREPVPTLNLIRERGRAEPDGLWTIAAAEMALDAAERSAARGRGRADISLFLASALFAWEQLQRDLNDRAVVLDGRTEFAADIYNRAVARFVSLTNQDWTGGEEPSVYDGRGGVFRVRAVVGDNRTLWDPAQFDWFRPTEELRVEGMRNHHRFDAFGATLLGFADNRPGRAAVDPFMPPEGLSYPATAVLRFGTTTTSLSDAVDAELELFNTLGAETTEVAGRTVPLSSDHTVPVGYLFGLTELGKEGVQGLTRPDRYLERIGIYMHQPYDPERIPVLFVHGLRSSPITWRDTLNDLMADPEIRRRCQFWMFLYPTGLPFPAAAAELRAALKEVRDYYDPLRTDPGMREMLVIGHSMGGLITRAVVQDGGDELFSAVYGRPLDGTGVSDGTRELLARIFYAPRDPDITRVVFVASPLRGADLATGFLARIGRGMVKLPEAFVQASRELRGYRPEGGWWHGANNSAVPTSIDTLRPDAPTLGVYNATPIEIPHHTIIGIEGAGDPRGGSDGVVAYWSASVLTAESEVIVRSGHNAHEHPLAIRELRRIVLKHLEMATSRRAEGPKGEGDGG